MSKIHNISRLSDRRKELRKNPTSQEEKLWWYLRDKRLGVKFRRQHSVGGYILDFYCKDKKLVVEIDGEIHQTIENKEYDEVRDKFFMELGYKILRFSNLDVDKNIHEVLERLKKEIG